MPASWVLMSSWWNAQRGGARPSSFLVATAVTAAAGAAAAIVFYYYATTARRRRRRWDDKARTLAVTTEPDPRPTNENVTIRVAEDGRAVSLVLVPEFAIGLGAAPLERLLAAVASSACLVRRLDVRGVDPKLALHQDFLARLIQALATNRGLQHLALGFGDSRRTTMDELEWCTSTSTNHGWRSDFYLVEQPARLFSSNSPFYQRRQVFLLNHQLWRLLWETIATHPTLRVLDVAEYDNYYATAYEREFRDNCIIRALAINQVLAELVHTVYDHDYVLMQTKILPALELNRFRNIAKVEDGRVRRYLLALALADPRWTPRYSSVRSYAALLLGCNHEEEEEEEEEHVEVPLVVDSS